MGEPFSLNRASLPALERLQMRCPWGLGGARSLSARPATLSGARTRGRADAGWCKTGGTVAVMKGGAENNASSAVSATDLLHGLAKAYEQFMSEGRLAVEPVDAYMPIFEALSWAAALDERIAAARGWSWRKHVSNGERLSPGSDSRATVPTINGQRCDMSR
jgi:hypothetical protein